MLVSSHASAHNLIPTTSLECFIQGQNPPRQLLHRLRGTLMQLLDGGFAAFVKLRQELHEVVNVTEPFNLLLGQHLNRRSTVDHYQP